MFLQPSSGRIRNSVLHHREHADDHVGGHHHHEPRTLGHRLRPHLAHRKTTAGKRHGERRFTLLSLIFISPQKT